MKVIDIMMIKPFLAGFLDARKHTNRRHIDYAARVTNTLLGTWALQHILLNTLVNYGIVAPNLSCSKKALHLLLELMI